MVEAKAGSSGAVTGAWLVSAVAGALLATGWHFFAARWMFRPSIVVTLLSVSLGINVTLGLRLTFRRRSVP